MADLTEDEKRKFGDGMGGYAAKRDWEYQVRWREELEQKQSEGKINKTLKLITQKQTEK